MNITLREENGCEYPVNLKVIDNIEEALLVSVFKWFAKNKLRVVNEFGRDIYVSTITEDDIYAL